MVDVIEPLTPKASVSISSFIDPTESSTTMVIRSLGNVSGNIAESNTPQESTLFGSGLNGNVNAASKKMPKNPKNVAKGRNMPPAQTKEDTYLDRIQSANPAYRIQKNTKKISLLHTKKYGKIPKIRKKR